MEAMKPQRPGGEDRVGVEPARCSLIEGYFFCPPVLFPTATKKVVFARRLFYRKHMLFCYMSRPKSYFEP